jgi:hypothetical protein
MRSRTSAPRTSSGVTATRCVGWTEKHIIEQRQILGLCSRPFRRRRLMLRCRLLSGTPRSTTTSLPRSKARNVELKKPGERVGRKRNGHERRTRELKLESRVRSVHTVLPMHSKKLRQYLPRRRCGNSDDTQSVDTHTRKFRFERMLAMDNFRALLSSMEPTPSKPNVVCKVLRARSKCVHCPEYWLRCVNHAMEPAMQSEQYASKEA